jgi:hypothetical protein
LRFGTSVRLVLRRSSLILADAPLLPDILTAFIRPRKHFRDMIRKTGGLGIAIENNCAIEFTDDQFYKVISSKSYARAYRLYERGGEVVAEQIRQEKQIAPVESRITG